MSVSGVVWPSAIYTRRRGPPAGRTWAMTDWLALVRSLAKRKMVWGTGGGTRREGRRGRRGRTEGEGGGGPTGCLGGGGVLEGVTSQNEPPKFFILSFFFFMLFTFYCKFHCFSLFFTFHFFTFHFFTFSFFYFCFLISTLTLIWTSQVTPQLTSQNEPPKFFVFFHFIEYFL